MSSPSLGISSARYGWCYEASEKIAELEGELEAKDAALEELREEKDVLLNELLHGDDTK